MCGRYTITFSSFLFLARRFNIGNEDPGFKPGYNVAPSQNSLIVIPGADGKNLAAHFRWGLIPFWAQEKSIGNRLINARAETVEQKPSFREAFKKRRALIPADGFYEWKKEKGKKIPYRFHLAGEEIFAFAGLWEEWKGSDGQVIRSFTIITAPAIEAVKPVHNRMPVILTPETEKVWLDPGAGKEELKEVLFSPASENICAYRVSTEVNSPRNDYPGLIKKVEGRE